MVSGRESGNASGRGITLSSFSIGFPYLRLREALLLQLKGQRVGGGGHAHDAVNVLRAEEACLMVHAAEIKVQV